MVTGRYSCIQPLFFEAGEELLQSTMENIGDGFYIIDAECRLLYINATVERILDIDRTDVLGKSFWEAFPLAQESRMEREYRCALRGESRDFEFFYEPLGRWFYNRCFPRKGGGMSVYFQDISARKQEEITLQENEQRLSFYVNHSPLATVEWNADFIVTRWAGGAERIFGWTSQETIGKRIMDLNMIYEQDIPIVQNTITKLIEGGDDYVVSSNRNYTKDGRVIYCEWYNTVVTNPEGEMQSVLSQILDVTERKSVEENILKANQLLMDAREQADAANMAKSEFLANMSHEIRTPLTSIMGFSQMLEFTDLTDQQAKYLDAVRKSSKCLLTLINDLLDFSKIEAGNVELEQSEFSLRSTISNLVKTQIFMIQLKGLDIKIEVPDEIPDLLTGDQLRLRQILLNLLSNAIKFTEKGGITITVSLSGQHGSQALVKIAVSDTGIGIDPEVIQKIFDPFIQADSTTTRKYGGTGLGLAICAKITKLMGGRLWAESREGVGSTFYLELPFAFSKNDEGRNFREHDTSSFLRNRPALRVLIVDDQLDNLFVVKVILQNVGYSIVEATDGKEALEYWERETFDVILMDIQMPVIDGINATRNIREKEKHRGGHIPIIALTARALPLEQEHIMRHGFDGYISKPFEPDALLSEIRRCLARIQE